MIVKGSALNVERCAPCGAFFLSYAAQDAEAVRVEVWFDQNEPVGGGAGDAKIRKQINACAFFVPVISALLGGARERVDIGEVFGPAGRAFVQQ